MAHHSRLFLAAGEVSGDARAAELLTALRAELGPLDVWAIGGPRLAAAGATLVRELDALHSVRIRELRERRAHWEALARDLPHLLRTACSDAIVLVQNPQVNCLVARVARTACPEARIVWYMPPEIWAWDFPVWLERLRPQLASRGKIVRDTCDAVVAVHPFERDAYLRWLPEERVHLIPHPALDYVSAAVPDIAQARATVRGDLGLGRTTRLVGLFPGSRTDEVQSLFGTMLSVARSLPQRDCAFVTVAASADLAARMRELDPDGVCTSIATRPFLEVLAACDLALLASGTSTLDAAVLGVPHVVMYRLDLRTYVLARLLGRVNWYGLPNIIAGREICPERRNLRATPARVLKTTRDLLESPDALDGIRTELQRVRVRLGGEGGIARGAGIIASYVASTR